MQPVMPEASDTVGGRDLESYGITGRSIPLEALALIGFQRTSQISAAARRAWEAGDRGPLEGEVRTRGEEMFRGALAEVHAEYLPLRAALSDAGRRPAQVVDIGCGQGLNDAFLFKDFGCRFTLVDIEETPEQYHNWRAEGAGYASLATARAFLEENGATEVETINPVRTPGRMAAVSGDLVTSLVSCGFHYPIGVYLDLFLSTLESGGAVVLDLRRRYAKSPDDALGKLFSASRQTVIPGANNRAQRTMFLPLGS